MVHVAEYLEWDSTELRPVSERTDRLTEAGKRKQSIHTEKHKLSSWVLGFITKLKIRKN